MKLLEYQGKELFSNWGIPVPRGKVITAPSEAKEAVQGMEGNIVLKVQLPVGGRGKAGGIKVIEGGDGIIEEAAKLLKMNIKGYAVEKLLAEEKLNIAEELYLGVVVDTDTGNIILLFSPEGGVDIEDVAAESPEKVYRLEVDPMAPPPVYRLRHFIRQAGYRGKILGELTKIAEKILGLFFSHDLLVAEINPLVILEDGRLVAGDAKVEVDDNALYRQKFEKNFWEEQDLLEKEARDIGVTYVKLKGNVGVIASGAGLGMATMDLLQEKQYAPANFLETGGGITEELMYNSLNLVCKNDRVKGVVVNLYGGVNPIEKGAKGIVKSIKEMKNPPWVVVKALGNKQEECWKTLKEGGVTVITSVKTEDAVERVIELMKNNVIEEEKHGKEVM